MMALCGNESSAIVSNPTYAPMRYSAPWARLRKFIVPRMIVSPIPNRANIAPSWSPLRRIETVC
jgi:hypothetical protein